MDIVSRLKTFIGYLRIPVTQFADNARIPRPSLSQLLNGRNRKVSDEVITKIHSAYPSLNMLWLLFGEGNMIITGEYGSSPDVDMKDRKIDSETTSTADDNKPKSETSNNTIDFSEDYPSTLESSDRNLINVENGSAYDCRSDVDQREDAKNQSPAGIFSDDILTQNNLEPDLSSEDKTSINDGEKGNPRFEHEVAHRSKGIKHINFSTGTSKTIVNIIIYYNDNSYESFVPEQIQ